ncbi:MAG: hypothetical protein L0Y72_28340 [Gemmataceae bacterium]|nr:hypothetical protein [Gemmataceae bacterium]MCI0742957.1 hypothetical protein [Gemmataceae bacterium]
MAGLLRTAALAALLVSASNAYGTEGWFGFRPRLYNSYYYSARPVYVVPAYCTTVTPLAQQAVVMPYAQPQAAPPSGLSQKQTPKQETTEPPIAQNKQPKVAPKKDVPKQENKEPPVLAAPLAKPPMVSESRSTAVTQAGHKAGKGTRCKVGFWNLTGRDITLKVDGKAQKLAKDRAVTIELERSFVWQVEQNEPTGERVPEDQAFYEVIIRK